jgi:hypothetical protein
VRILYLSDRLSLRGGADRHLLQVISWAAGAGHRVAVAAGRIESGVSLPAAVACERLCDLASPSSVWTGGQRLERLLGDADLVHCQNLMNPAALAAATATGRAVVAERFARAPIERRLEALYDAAAGFVGSGAAG